MPTWDIEGFKSCFTKGRSGERVRVCTGKGDRIQGPEFQVAQWSGLSAGGSSTDQKRIHVVRKLPAGVGIEGPLHF